jgi:hypothetical protein
MKRLYIPALLILTLVLTACSATATPLQTDHQPATASTEPSSASSNAAIRVDEQGAIVIEITPLNLDASTDTLEFDVIMNTHSIDLNMDLATLSILTTDTGIALPATTWDAPRGGHHVEGKLIFPSMKDGNSILAGVRRLTLTIINLDASSRVFEWELK